MAQELRPGYRIPTIEEFVDGFEYSLYSEGCFEDSMEDFFGWYNYKFNKGLCFRDIEDIGYELSCGNIQVKCI